MAEPVTAETNSLTDFVITNYTSLLSSVKTSVKTDDDDDEINKVILLIEKLFETFKKLDSHDAIVDQVLELQAAYITLDLDLNDYPRYAAASANLKTIVVALKEDDAGSKVEEEVEEE